LVSAGWLSGVFALPFPEFMIQNGSGLEILWLSIKDFPGYSTTPAPSILEGKGFFLR
jgi:hypothetical protein